MAQGWLSTVKMRLVITGESRYLQKGSSISIFYQPARAYQCPPAQYRPCLFVARRIDSELFTCLPYPLDGGFFQDRDLGSCLSLCLQSLAWRLAWSGPIDFWEEIKGSP